MDKSVEQRKSLLRRLKRIEGQIRGIHRMIEEDKYCVDILVQVAAARAALDKVGLALLEGHTRDCLIEAIKKEQHSEKAINELMELLLKFVKK